MHPSMVGREAISALALLQSSTDDCSTRGQRGKIERYGREGKATPYGQVIDRAGNVRTDTEGILQDLIMGKAALCPLGGSGEEMGGYKVGACVRALAGHREHASSSICRERQRGH